MLTRSRFEIQNAFSRQTAYTKKTYNKNLIDNFDKQTSVQKIVFNFKLKLQQIL